MMTQNPPQRYMDHVRLTDNRAVHVCWVCRKATLAQIAYTIVHTSVSDAQCAFCGATNAFGRLDFDASEPVEDIDDEGEDCETHGPYAEPECPKCAAPAIYDDSTLARFWAKVDTSGDCWIWTAAKSDTGYGSFWINPTRKNTHRVSYEIAHGSIPDGVCVLHRCDNRACVRPDHLFLGTVADNNHDMWNKGRGRTHVRYGAAINTSKFTEEQVREIRRRYTDEHIPKRALAREYGVTPRAIYCIVEYIHWRHLSATIDTSICTGCDADILGGERCTCAADAAANAHMHAIVGFDLDDDDAYSEALHIAATGGLL